MEGRSAAVTQDCQVIFPWRFVGWYLSRTTVWASIGTIGICGDELPAGEDLRSNKARDLVGTPQP